MCSYIIYIFLCTYLKKKKVSEIIFSLSTQFLKEIYFYITDEGSLAIHVLGNLLYILFFGDSKLKSRTKLLFYLYSDLTNSRTL